MFRDSFYGQKISDYGRKYGFVDYHALASSFDAVLCNSILNYRDGFEDWEQVHGFVDNSEVIAEANEELEKLKSRKLELEAKIDELENEDTTNAEIYQWYIISGSGAQILEENTSEILYYNEELDLYVWGVTHWGTSWDYVLTSIPCETYEQQKQREAEEAKPKEIGDFTDEELDQMAEELLNLWDADENEKEPTADDATPTEAETVEADKPQNEDVQLLRTWQTIAKIERAIDEETKRIRTEEGTAYANECYRMMRHNFDIGDIVAHEDGGMPWRVSDMDRLGDTLDIELDGEHLTVNRWDVFGISSKGEEVHTPCTVGELETLKAQRMWI